MNPNRIRIAATTSDSKFPPPPFLSHPTAFSYIHISARLTCLSLFALMVMVLLLPVGGWEGGDDWLYDSVGQKGAMCIERNAISTSIVFG